MSFALLAAKVASATAATSQIRITARIASSLAGHPSEQAELA